jgi:hypothetical protein
MMSAGATLKVVAASLPCRVLAIGLGVAVIWLYGFRIFAGLINPMNFAHFALAIYLLLAAIAAFALYFLRDPWLLGFILPAAFLIGADAVWPHS